MTTKALALQRNKLGAFRDRNFMTPHVVGYGQIHRGLYFELSWGEGIFDRNSKLYGVTLATATDMLNMDPRNKCLHSREAAEAYIVALQTGRCVHEDCNVPASKPNGSCGNHDEDRPESEGVQS